jgi:hypothetical protein
MHINALISNYSYLDSAHFWYWDLLVTSLCKSFHKSLFLYMFANPIFFKIRICCYVFMRSPICMTMLYIFLIWCLRFILEYVHLDMHIFNKFKVFKFPNTKLLGFSNFPCLLVSFLLHQGFVKTTLKVSPLLQTFCVFEHMRFKLQIMNIWGLKSEHLKFEMWNLSLSIWGLNVIVCKVWDVNFKFEHLRSECYRFKHLRSKHLRFEVWTLSCEGLRSKV